MILKIDLWFIKKNKKKKRGTSPAVQWLRFCLPVQGVRVQSQSLIRKPRSHMPCGQKTKTEFFFFLKLNFILKKVGNKDVKTLTMVIFGWLNLESTCFFFSFFPAFLKYSIILMWLLIYVSKYLVKYLVNGWEWYPNWLSKGVCLLWYGWALSDQVKTWIGQLGWWEGASLSSKWDIVFLLSTDTDSNWNYTIGYRGSPTWQLQIMGFLMD